MGLDLNREQQEYIENNFRRLTDQELAAKLQLQAEDIREYLLARELRRSKEDWDAINNRDALAKQAENLPEFSLPQEGLPRLLAPVLLALFAVFPLIHSNNFHIMSTPQVFVWEIIILSAFAVWLVGAALVSRIRLTLGVPFLPLALLAVLAFASYFSAKNQPEALLGAFDYAIFFATYFIAANLFRRQEEINSAAGALGLGALLAGFWICSYYVFNLDPTIKWAERSANLPIFGNFSYASAYFMAALPLTVAMIFISRHIYFRGIWIAASAIIGFLIIILRSRTEWFAISIAFFISAILFLWKYPFADKVEAKKIRKLGMTIILALTVLAGALVWFTPSLKSRLSSAFDPNDPSRRIRVCIWNSTLEMAKENGWWRGCGAGNYMDSVEPHRVIEERILSGFNSMVEKAHNEFLDTLALFGIPGLATFVLVLLAGLWCGWRVISRAPSRRVFWLGLGLTTVFVAQIADGIANNPILYFPTSGYFFWVTLGLLAALNKSLAPVSQQEEPKRVGIPRLVFCLFGAWLAVVGLIYFPYGKLMFSFVYHENENAVYSFEQEAKTEAEIKFCLEEAIKKLDICLAFRPGNTIGIGDKKNRLIDLMNIELKKKIINPTYIPDKTAGNSFMDYARKIHREWLSPQWLDLLDGQKAFYEEKLALANKTNKEWNDSNKKGRHALENALKQNPYFTEARAQMIRLELLGPPTQEKINVALNQASEGALRLDIAAQILKRQPVSQRTNYLRRETVKIQDALYDLPVQWNKTDFYQYVKMGDFFQHEVLKIRAIGKRGESKFHYNVEGYLYEDFETWMRMIQLRNHSNYASQDARIFCYALLKFSPKFNSVQRENIIRQIELAEQGLEAQNGTVNGYFYMNRYWREYQANPEIFMADIQKLPVQNDKPLITLENTNWTRLCNILRKGEGDQVLSPERALWDTGLSLETRKIIKEQNPSIERKLFVIRDLNEKPLRAPGFFREEYFKAIPIPEALRKKIEIAHKKQQLDRELEEINFEVMKTVYPDLFKNDADKK